MSTYEELIKKDEFYDELFGEDLKLRAAKLAKDAAKEYGSNEPPQFCVEMFIKDHTLAKKTVCFNGRSHYLTAAQYIVAYLGYPAVANGPTMRLGIRDKDKGTIYTCASDAIAGMGYQRFNLSKKMGWLNYFYVLQPTDRYTIPKNSLPLAPELIYVRDLELDRNCSMDNPTPQDFVPGYDFPQKFLQRYAHKMEFFDEDSKSCFKGYTDCKGLNIAIEAERYARAVSYCLRKIKEALQTTYLPGKERLRIARAEAYKLLGLSFEKDMN